MLEQALEYAGKGWPVFPLHSPRPTGCSCGRKDCDRIGKHPRTPNGRDDATTESSKIEKWWGTWPDANIGIATGHGLVVVDFDIDHERGKFGDETLSLLQEEHEELPETVMALTGGGGIHYFFRCSADDLTIGQDIRPGMDFRGNGGYVVAPPSLHASGNRYEWEAAHTPEDTELAALPTWLHDVLAAGKGEKRQRHFEAPEAITEGGRNGTLFKWACALRDKGLTLPAMTAAIWEENLLRCKPPLSRKEIETICNSAGRYQRGDGLDRLQADVSTEERIAGAVQGDFEELTAKDVLEGILRLTDPVMREEGLAALRGRAKALHRVRDFDRLLKAYQEAAVKAAEADAAKRSPDTIELPDCPLPGLSCRGWSVERSGVSRITFSPNGPEREEACPHPVLITERLTNIDTGGERVKIAFYRDKQWRDLIVDRSMIASRQKIVELADSGIQVNSENAKLLIKYLSDLEAQNTSRIPRKQCISRLGWSSRNGNWNGFVPYMDGVQYDGDPKFAAYFCAIGAAGSYETWKNYILPARGRSTAFRAALAASFASPLMWPLGAQVFFLHLWGGTEAGKTVAQMAAMSVWGNPDLGALLRSYNATYVGMERMAAFCHSIPLALDEQQTVRNNRYFDMDTLIYNLCEGQGKGRGTKGGSLENLSTWRLCILSSGEGPLTSSKSGGGGKNRVLEVYCKEKLFIDAPKMADIVKANYGHAGQEYIRALSNPGVMESAKKAFGFYRGIFQTVKHGTDKQAASAAMLAVGDYLSAVIVFGMTPEEANKSTTEFCYVLSEQYLTEASEISQVERAYQWVCDWIAANPGQFERQQSGGMTYHDDRNKLWGKQTDIGYAVIASILEWSLEQAGFIVEACKKGFVERGYIVPGGKTIAKQLRVGGNRPRCYELVMPQSELGSLEEIEDNDPEDPWREGERTIPFPGGRV